MKPGSLYREHWHRCLLVAMSCGVVPANQKYSTLAAAIKRAQ